ncbi:MAG: hypothetical protein KIT00_00935 [Rhodospirillales bacterium]|nr:hypothetical protein [Rhodospirillales bacterium]
MPIGADAIPASKSSIPWTSNGTPARNSISANASALFGLCPTVVAEGVVGVQAMS